MLKSITHKILEIKDKPYDFIVEILIGHGSWYFGAAIIWSIYTFILKVIDPSLYSKEEIIIIGVLLVLSSTVLMVFLSFIRWLYLTYNKKSKLENLVEFFGIKGFYPAVSKEERLKQWKLLVDYLNKTKPQSLRILCHNGWETFADPGTPLHDYLKKFSGDLIILLIDPNSEACKKRCNGLDTKPLKIGERHYYELFLEQYNNTLLFLQSIKQSGVNVRLHIYSQPPIWKIIATENHMWLQHYKKFVHVDEEPVYLFYKNNEQTSLFFALLEIFPKKIADIDTKEYPLV